MLHLQERIHSCTQTCSEWGEIFWALCVLAQGICFVVSCSIPMKGKIKNTLFKWRGGENQLSFDKYIVACSSLCRIQRDIYHCSCGKEGRKREGGGPPVLRHIVYLSFFNPYYFLSLGKIFYLPPLIAIWDFLCLFFSSFISTIYPNSFVFSIFLFSIVALITLHLLTTLLLKWIMKQKYVKLCRPPQLWQQKVTTSGIEM